MNTPETIKAKIGSEIGLSDWFTIDQDKINRFADLTEDHQFIHVNPDMAAQTSFGGTIAHGFFVLSMIAKFGLSADFVMEGVYMALNYGFEKVRLIAPVKVDKRIRGRFVLKDMVERAPGQWLSTMTVTIEIEGENKPAIIADWLGLQYVRQA
ncbi:MAG: MaoC family dehydratase [Terricaulis sp.]